MMSGLLWLATGLVLGLLVYLFWVLLQPQDWT